MMAATADRAHGGWSDRRAVVVGAGRSGRAAARLLAYLGARVTLTDARDADRLPDLAEIAAAGVALQLGGHPESLWRDVDAVIASPGISPQAAPFEAARAHGLQPLAEIELAASLARAPFVAVTGSNGKSTVTAMVGAILQRAGLRAPVCGNIGVALSDVVLGELQGNAIDRFVAELSSFQTEQIVDFRPRWAAILNLSADHLDRHGSLEAYGVAKLGLVRNCTAQDWLVYGADDPWLVDHLPTSPMPAPFSAAATDGAPAAWIDGSSLCWRDPDGVTTGVLPLSELRVVGAHNALNACAAIAIGCLAGADPEVAASALRDFRGLEHRMEPCGSIGGVLCINDSKATNVGATAAALAGLDRPTWLILGGRDKDSEFERLRPLLADHIRGVLLIGEAAERIESAIAGAVPTRRCGDLERAIDAALESAAAGDALLLAPACTSFDQFDDFEHRGRCFKEIVAARAAETTVRS